MDYLLSFFQSNTSQGTFPEDVNRTQLLKDLSDILMDYSTEYCNRAFLKNEFERMRLHTSNHEVKCAIFRMLLKIYKQIIFEKTQAEQEDDDEHDYPKQPIPWDSFFDYALDRDAKDFQDLFNQNQQKFHDLLSFNEMFAWYDNELHSLLGEFSLNTWTGVEQENPAWYPQMITKLYDTFMFRKDIYEKCKKHFNL